MDSMLYEAELAPAFESDAPQLTGPATLAVSPEPRNQLVVPTQDLHPSGLARVGTDLCAQESSKSKKREQNEYAQLDYNRKSKRFLGFNAPRQVTDPWLSANGFARAVASTR